MRIDSVTGLYYDPYRPDINADPYPVYRRLRDEAPLYYNEPHDFYAVSRFEDVERCLVDRETFSSAKSSVHAGHLHWGWREPDRSDAFIVNLTSRTNSLSES